MRKNFKYFRSAGDTVYVVEDKLIRLEARLKKWEEASRERDKEMTAQLTRIESLLTNHMNAEP